MPKISVVMPTYNSDKYIKAAIESVLHQTFSDWELLVINEFGADDTTAQIVTDFGEKDKRIFLIQNDKRLGLAESLNKGIRMARGEYIARLDADDLAHPERFEKQVALLDTQRNVVMCGTYQHHFGKTTDFIHKPSCDAAQCRANTLFFCDLCHSTLMIRRDTLVQNNLFYDDNYAAEDFELWTRLVRYGDIVNINEVLGEYRWDGDNITNDKFERLHFESGQIVAKSLEDNLGMRLTDDEKQLFCNWRNDYHPMNKKKKEIINLRRILGEIYIANKRVLFYDEQALLNSIGAKWRWACYYEPYNNVIPMSNIGEALQAKRCIPILNRMYYFWKNNNGTLKKIKKIGKKIWNT